MLFLDGAATRASLPMGDAIEAMEHAFTGEAETPLRTLVGGSLVMPGRLDDHTAVKVVSIVPGSPAGLVALFGPDGQPIGVVDGPTLTSIRTGAVCGLATRLLAPDGPATLAMLGAGAMAFDQIEAIRAVRDVREVLVWSRNPDRAAALAERVGGVAIGDPDDAVSGADIVSCATPAREPLFHSEAVSRASHFNAVGAFTAEMAELPEGLLSRAYVVVDDYEAAAVEAGDLIQAGRWPDTSLSELLAGRSPDVAGRATVFKSVGIATQDVAAAQRALANGKALGLGVELG
jgi:ornithine cyclodeaminase/alanine dehydrogenase-like protein (mu-crystallin family)